MYAVVYKNRVIVGPMAWNRAIFQGSLAKEQIQVQLPRVPPDTWPLTVNSDAFIVPVQELRPNMNPMVEYYYGPLWDIQANLVIARYDVLDQPIESARQAFKAQAAGERYNREVSGVTREVQGMMVTLDTSRDGRNIFVQKLAFMADADTVNWKFPEAWLLLTKSDLAGVVQAGAAHIQSCFDWEKGISDQIDAAQTKQALLEIQIMPVSPPEPEPQ